MSGLIMLTLIGIAIGECVLWVIEPTPIKLVASCLTVAIASANVVFTVLRWRGDH